MRGIITEKFEGYSDEAMEQVIVQCPGKPVTAGFGGRQVGKIISGERIDNTNLIMFIVEFDFEEIQNNELVI